MCGRMNATGMTIVDMEEDVSSETELCKQSPLRVSPNKVMPLSQEGDFSDMAKSHTTVDSGLIFVQRSSQVYLYHLE